MKKLFKAAFYSLRNSKVSIIGLTILVFLASSIFTMLADIKHAYQSKFDDYNQVSNLHDMTVDLDVKPSGHMPGDGYSKTPDEIYIAKGTEGTYRGLSVSGYHSFDNFQQTIKDTNGKEIKNLDTTFLKIDSLVKWAHEEKQHDRIKSNNPSANLQSNLAAKFDFANYQFTMQRDEEIDRYVYDSAANDYQIQKDKIEVNAGDEISWYNNKTPQILDWITYKDGSWSNYDASVQIKSSLYINVKTKEATIETQTGSVWAGNGEAIELNVDYIAKNILALAWGNNRWQVSQKGKFDDMIWTESGDRNIAEHPWFESVQWKPWPDNDNLKFNSKFKLTQAMADLAPTDPIAVERAVLKQGQTYKLNPAWVKEIKTEVHYTKHSFVSNYKTNKDEWTGSYLDFAKENIEVNDKLHDHYAATHYWTKEIINLDEHGKDEEHESVITPQDFKFEIRNEQGSYTGETIDSLENLTGIEGNEYASRYYNLTDIHVKDNLTLEIKEAVKKISVSKLQTHVKGLVGEDHMGQRDTLTIDSFDTNDNSQSVFQFVNADEKINKNIDKMYYEQKGGDESRYLSNIDSLMTESLRSEYIGYEYTSLVIDATFNGYRVDQEYYDMSKSTIFRNVAGSTHKIITLNNDEGRDDHKYGITKDGDEFWILKEDNGDWSIDNGQIFTYLELQQFIIKNKTIIKGTVGVNGQWFALSKKDSSIYIPVEFRNLPKMAINDAVNHNSYEDFFNAISQFLIGEFSKPGNQWVEKEVLETIIEGFKRSFEFNHFADAMQSGKIRQELLGKMIFDAFYYSNKTSSNFSGKVVKELFSNILQHISDSIASQGGLDEQREYIKTTLESVGKVYEAITGINIMDSLSEYIQLDKLVKVSKDPIALIKGIQDLMNAIDLDKWMEEIHDWYESNWNGLQPKGDGSENNPYITFTTKELVTTLFDSLDGVAAKNAINNLIDNVDFAEVESMIIDTLKDKLTKTDWTALEPIIKKMGIKEAPFKDMIKVFVQRLDFKKLAEELDNSFVKGKEELTIDDKQTWFTTQKLSSNAIIASTIKSIFKTNDDQNAIINAIISGLNLSSKIVLEEGYAKPGHDADKLGLLDLQDLEKLSYSKIDKLDIESKRIAEYKAISDLTKEDIAWINSFGKLYISERMTDDEKLATAKEVATSIKNIVRQLTLDKMTFKQKASGNFSADWTLSDMMWKMLSPYAYDLENTWDFINDPIRNETHKGAFQAVQGTIEASKYSAGTNMLAAFDFWIQYASVLIEEIMSADKSVSYNDAKSYAQQNINKLLNIIDHKDYKNIFIEGANSTKVDPSGGCCTSFAEETLQRTPYSLIKTAKVSSLLVSGRAFQGAKQAKIDEIFSKPTNSKVDVNAPLEGNVNKMIRDIKSLGNAESRQFLIDNIDAFVTAAGMYAFPAKENLGAYDKIVRDGTKFLLNNLTIGDHSIFGTSVMQKDILSTFSKGIAGQSGAFQMLGLSPSIASTYLGSMYPTVAKYFTTSENQGDGNITFTLKERLREFFNMSRDEIKNSLDVFIEDKDVNTKVETFGLMDIKIDLDMLDQLEDELDDAGDIFGFEAGKILGGIIETSTEIVKENGIIKFLNVGSYVSRVSESYMALNGKEAYEGVIPESTEEMKILLKTLDKKYKINANNQEFLILGKETAIDYMYPVLDREHINVDTKTQAVVWVNQYGFDRVRFANRAKPISTYLVIKKGEYKGTLQELEDEINQYSTDNELNMVGDIAFTKDRLDMLYPERSLRTKIVKGVMDAVTQMNDYGLVILLTLVGLITVFIGKRYIDNRREVIGILRAQGYTPMQIALSFIVFAMVTALVGGVAGYIVGHLMQMPLMSVFKTYWTVPTDPLSFNWVSMVLTVIFPFVGMSLVLIVSTLYILRTKPIDLMSGSHEAASGWLSRIANKPFKRFTIKTRFTATLAFNTLGKMFSLMIAITLAAFTAMFAISSNGVFHKAVTDTYSQRNYVYRTDLLTPTVEGGLYDTIDKNSKESMEQIYVPFGVNKEGNKYVAGYFRPGYSPAINYNQHDKSDLSQDQIDALAGKAHILSKASLDIKIDAGISTNPWNIAKNSMPDSQYVSATRIANEAGAAMELTQLEGNNSKGKVYENFEEMENDDTSYYKYFINEKTNEGKFYLMIPSQTSNYPIKAEVSTETTKRLDFRNFLVKAYQYESVDDYQMIYGGVNIDDKNDETYSWARINLGDNNEVKIIGVKEDSKSIIPEDFDGNKLMKELSNFNTHNKDANTIPILINHVLAEKHGYSEGQTLNVNITNTVDRYISKYSKAKNVNKDYKLHIVGINSTYINDEILALQTDVNKITGMDTLDNHGRGIPFNGVFSLRGETPSQAIDNLLIYSTSGFWGASDEIDINTISQSDKETVYTEIFGKDGLLDKQGVTKEEVSKAFFGGNAFEYLDFATNPIPQGIDGPISDYTADKLYGKAIYASSIDSVGAKALEVGFISNISGTVNKLTMATIGVTIAISAIVLIIISTMIISENKKKIAIFSIMGYKEREKVRMFMLLYVPFILMAIAIAIPITYGLIEMFSSLILGSANMALPIVMNWVTILLAVILIICIFAVVISISYISLRRIKAIYILQGED